MRKEEGHYTIKIVDRLPKRGNFNFIYLNKEDSKLYKWTFKSKYEVISVNTENPTLIQEGNNITITGTGTDLDPYVISAVPVPQYTLDINSNSVRLLRDGTVVSTEDLSLYLDDTNLSRLTSGTLNGTTGIATFTRDDNSIFDVDFSALLGGGGGAFETITEGSNIGIRTEGFDPNNFGNIGNDAIDIQRSTGASTTVGATANLSVAIGLNNQVSGFLGVGVGNGNTASGTSSFVFGDTNNGESTSAYIFGQRNVVSGTRSYAFGEGNEVTSGFESALGHYGTIGTAVNPGGFSNPDRLFNIGNGNSTFNRSDAFTIVKNGEVGIGINNFESNNTGEKFQVNGKIKAIDINFTGLQVFSDDASAGTGGLVSGDCYRTATGELRIKL